MAESPKLTIRRGFARPSAAAMAPFAAAATGPIVDALGRRGALPHWIRPITSATRILGPALTVRTRATDNLAPYAALSVARPGDVLVVACSGAEDGSLMGDILVGMARNAGIAGVVTDGLVRDRAGIEATGMPTFSRGLSPNSPQKDGPGAIGLPIAIGDVVIEAGDLVIADADGVVIAPRASLAAAAVELKAILAKEAAMERSTAEGARAPAWLANRLAAADVAYLDE